MHSRSESFCRQTAVFLLSSAAVTLPLTPLNAKAASQQQASDTILTKSADSSQPQLTGESGSPSQPNVPPPTVAQDSGPKSTGDQVQDIVVTARRQSEALSRVPISVSAYTQQTLDRRGVKDIADVVRFTPGITFDKTGTGSTNISIRGISSDSGASTTGVYIMKLH